MNISNIQFSIEEYAIEFHFDMDGQDQIATLQLPDTGDSEHYLNEREFDMDDSEQEAIFNELKKHYFSEFNDIECAAASALLGQEIDKVVEVEGYYIAFSGDEAEVIEESRYKSYYNKQALFERVYDESIDQKKLIDLARSL